LSVRELVSAAKKTAESSRLTSPRILWTCCGRAVYSPAAAFDPTAMAA